MKKKITINHTHRYTKEQQILFKGLAMCEEFDDYKEYRYIEKDGTKVIMYAYADHMVIERLGEVHSCLSLYKGKVTKNPMKSEFGTFHIEVKTIDYIRDDTYVMVEYDVESGQVDKDGFKIEVKEETHEYH